jgi:hypothetical protein
LQSAFVQSEHTKPIQRNPSIVHHEIDTLCVRLFQMRCQTLNTTLVRDVQMVVFDLCKPAISFQCFGFLQLCILFQLCECGFASSLVAGGEVDEKGTVVEGRFGVLECELANNR